jgi:predicted amidohydrolase
MIELAVAALQTAMVDDIEENIATAERLMQRHAGANLMPLVAANRIGYEVGQTGDITFYGSLLTLDGRSGSSSR